MMNLIAIFIGGGIGAMLRYIISTMAKHFFMFTIVGTFISNIIGCFLIGFLFALTLNKAGMLPDYLKALLIVGFLGGLTTFSTFNIEIFELIKNGKIFYGLIYMVSSCVVGLLVTYLGYMFFSKTSL